MFRTLCLQSLVFGVCLASFTFSGCSKEEAAQTAKDLEQSAEGASETVAKDVGEMVDKGKEMASELSEKAVAYLTSIKDKLGSLDNLKEKPVELKGAVSDLIESIEGEAENLNLPEKVSATLAIVKEKLVALRDYLAGEIDQAKVEEHMQAIKDAVKSGLGVSGE